MLHRFLSDENGATAIEYGLIAGLIALTIIGALTGTSGSVKSMWDDNESKITEALTASD